MSVKTRKIEIDIVSNYSYNLNFFSLGSNNLVLAIILCIGI